MKWGGQHIGGGGGGQHIGGGGGGPHRHGGGRGGGQGGGHAMQRFRQHLLLRQQPISLKNFSFLFYKIRNFQDFPISLILFYFLYSISMNSGRVEVKKIQ